MPSGTDPGVPAINARDRVGNGPWLIAKGEWVARDVAQLHSTINLSKTSAPDEKGQVIKGRGDTPHEHDSLTGSRKDGTAFAAQTDTPCGAWTPSGPTGSAIVGQHDRNGPRPKAWAQSWNCSHPSAGCSQEALERTGGAGRFYCFAAKERRRLHSGLSARAYRPGKTGQSLTLTDSTRTCRAWSENTSTLPSGGNSSSLTAPNR